MKKIVFAVALLLFAKAAIADEIPEFKISIKNHKFVPAEITVPADKKIKLLVKNNDATAEEFESHELKREKIIAPGSEGVIFIGPLGTGAYPFFGEYNEKTAQGKIIVK